MEKRFNCFSCRAWQNATCHEIACPYDLSDMFPRPACNLQVGDKATIMLPGPYQHQIGTVVRKQLLEVQDRTYQIYFVLTRDGNIQDFFDDELNPVEAGVQYAS